MLPEPKEPVGAYIATKKVNNLLFVSGQISIDEKGKLRLRGLELLLEPTVIEAWTATNLPILV